MAEDYNENAPDSQITFSDEMLLGWPEDQIAGQDKEFICCLEVEDKEAVCRQIVPSKVEANEHLWTGVYMSSLRTDEDKGVFRMLQFSEREGQLLGRTEVFISFIRTGFLPAVDRYSPDSVEDDVVMDSLYERLKSGFDSLFKILKRAPSSVVSSLKMALIKSNIHVIATTLILTLATDKRLAVNESLTMTKLSNSQPAQVEGKRASISSMLRLLNLIASNCSETCLELVKLEDQLFYILANVDAELAGTLLTVIFSLVDPYIDNPVDYFATWFSRLSPVTADVIKQQSIIIMTLAGLCEINEIPTLTHQNLLIAQLFNSTAPFPLLKLLMTPKGVLVHFCQKATSLFYMRSDLLSGGSARTEDLSFVPSNPDLAKLREERIGGLDYYNLNEVCQLKDYETYIYRVFKLFYFLTRENKDAASKLEILGIEPRMLIWLTKDASTSMLIRTAAMLLVSSMFVVVHGNYSFVTYQYKYLCFNLEEMASSEGSYEVYSKFLPPTHLELLNSLLEWLLSFWLKKVNLELELVEIGTEGLPVVHTLLHDRLECLEYLLAAFQLTFSIIDSQLCEPFYIQCINRAFVFALIGVSESSVNHLGSHWLVQLLHNTMTGKSLKLKELATKVTVATLKLYSLIEDISVIKRVQETLMIFNVINARMSLTNTDFISVELGRRLQLINTTQDPLTAALRQHSPHPLLLSWLRNYKINSADIMTDRLTPSQSLLSLTFNDIDFPIEVHALLINLHRNLLNDSELVYNKLTKTDLILSKEHSDLRQKIEDIDDAIDEALMIENIQMEMRELHKSSTLETLAGLLRELMGILQLRYVKQSSMQEKAQNIVRHYRIHISLIVIWKHLNTYDEAKAPGHEIHRTVHEIVVVLFYFVRCNLINMKSLARHLTPDMFNLQVPRIASLINEVADEYTTKVDFFKDFVASILFLCPSSDPKLFGTGVNWVQTFLFSSDSTPRSELQNIVSIAFAKVIQKQQLQADQHPEVLAAVYTLLAQCAVGNSVVIYQCRRLLPHPTFPTALKQSLDRPDMVAALFAFYNAVYLMPHQSVKHDSEFFDTAAEMLEVVIDLFRELLGSLGQLPALAEQGLYELVVSQDFPIAVDIAQCQPPDFNKFRELMWLLAAGDPWNFKTGLVTFMTSLLSIGKSSLAVMRMAAVYTELLGNLSEVLSEQAAKYPSLDYSPLRIEIDRAVIKFGRISFRQQSDIIDFTESDLTQAKEMPRSIEKTSEQQDNLIKVLLQALLKLEQDSAEQSFISNLIAQLKQIPVIKDLFAPGIQRDKLKKAGSMLSKLLEVSKNPKTKSLIFTVLSQMCEDSDANKESFTKAVIHAKCLDMALESILSSRYDGEVEAALKFLNVVLSYRKGNIQNVLRDLIIKEDRITEVFMLLKAELNDSKERINKSALEHAKSKKRSEHAKAIRESRVISRQVDKAGQFKHSWAEGSKFRQVRLFCKMFQLACDNCHLSFQDLMREQETTNKCSINVVELVANYFIEVVSAYEDTNLEALIMIQQALDALIEFTTGPCPANQAVLANKVQIYQAIKYLLQQIDLVIQGTATHGQGVLYVKIYRSLIGFLLTLTEGVDRPAHAKVLIAYLDLQLMKDQTVLIFEKYIRGRVKSVLLEVTPEMAKERASLMLRGKSAVSHQDAMLIRSGLLAAILLTQLRVHDPANPILKPPASTATSNDSLSWKTLVRFFKLAMPYELDTSSADEFYSSFIGMVELKKDDRIEQHYFPIPFKAKFLTYKTRHEIISEVDRSSQQEQLENFLQKSKVCHAEMTHQQTLCMNETLKQFSSEWQLYNLISLLFIYCINLYLLFKQSSAINPSEVSYAKNDYNSNNLLAFGICQLVFASLGFSCYLIEYYQTIIARGRLKDTDLEMTDYYSIPNNDSVIMKLVYSRMVKPLAVIEARKVHYFMADIETIYFVCFFFPMSLCSLFFPYLYPFLLLDIIKRSTSVRNIVESIYVNKFQLFMTSVLGTFVIYIFSVYGFMNFSGCYDNCDDYHGDCESRSGDYNSFCSTLSECFISTLHLGLRSGGGIGDAIMKPSQGSISCNYWDRMAFDLIFFIVIILVLLNIVFGIIIDTYSDRRIIRMEAANDIENVCYICGAQRSELEKRQEWWSQHFMKRHSPFAYLSFIAYIKEKNVNDCTGLEKYVWQQISENKTNFFPLEDNEDA
jgi:hypothetical protein